MKDVTIVTGANRGIGKAIAYKFAEEGHKLALFARNESLLKEVSDEIADKGAEVIYFAGDIADEEFVKKSIKTVYDRFGKIDHLINNAGVAYFDEFVDSTLERFKRQIDTNLYGIYNCTKAVVNDMIERKNGSIISISSLAGKNAFKKGTMYGATKHAVNGFTKSLMLELREHNIRVAAVCPGSVATDLIMGFSDSPANKRNILEPADIAEVVSDIIKLPVRALVSELDIRPLNPKGK